MNANELVLPVKSFLQATALAGLAFANKHPQLVQACYFYRKHTPFQSQSYGCTVYNTFTFMNYKNKDHSAIKITSHGAWHAITNFESHSWLWAQQSQAIDSHCFHMQLLTTTFLFTIIHEDRTSENRPRQW